MSYKEETNVSAEKRRTVCRIYKGATAIAANRISRTVVLVLAVAMLIIGGYNVVTAPTVMECYGVIGWGLMAAILGAMACYLASNPLKSTEIEQGLYRAGVVNSAGESPILIAVIPLDGNAYRLAFLASGVPISEWKDKQAAIEAALNMVITRIAQGKTRREIEITCIDGAVRFPDMISFNETRFGLSDTELLLGKDITGAKILMDLSVIPHALIGGATGSGKTILLKSLLIQSVNKGMKVVVIDLKGGADYSETWNANATLLMSHEHVQTALEGIVDEMERRKQVFHSAGTKDIDTYNEQNSDKLVRIVIGCDEIADLLVVKGLSKEEKETVQDITAMLSKIARQGRAFGIHLLLATQRPDADVLSGQIKSNMGLRVCGRANDILSRIILDDDSASELIPSDAQGLFIDQDGVIFKAPYCTDEDFEKGGKYERGANSR